MTCRPSPPSPAVRREFPVSIALVGLAFVLGVACVFTGGAAGAEPTDVLPSSSRWAAVHEALEDDRHEEARRLVDAIDRAGLDEPLDRCRLDWLRARTRIERIAHLDDQQHADFLGASADSTRRWLRRAFEGLDALGPGSEPALRGALWSEVGRVDFVAGALDSATVRLRRAVDLLDAHLRRSDPVRRRALDRLAWTLRAREDYEAAARVSGELLDTLRAMDPVPRFELSGRLGAHASLLSTLGRRGEAAAHFEEALAVLVAIGREVTTSGASTRLNYGALLRKAGRLDEARAQIERSIEIREQVYDPDHPEVSRALNNLGNLLMDQGEVVAARAAYERALAIDERVLGPEHRNLASRLVNLAILLAEIGDLDGAFGYFVRALEVAEGGYGPDHLITGQIRLNYGIMLALDGRHAEAQERLGRAREIFAERLGDDHYLTLTAELERATSLREIGRLDEARELLEEGLPRLETVIGDDHPDLAPSLRGLARIHRAEGDLDRALVVATRAHALERDTLGSDHPKTATSLLLLAELQAAAGRFEAAFDAALEAERAGRAHLRLTARGLSEREALEYARERPRGIDLALALLDARSRGGEFVDPEHVHRVWDAVVRSRALVLDELAARHRVVRVVDDPRAADALRELAAARTALAELSLRGPQGETAAHYRAALAAARQRRERAERTMAAAGLDDRRGRRGERVGWEEVLTALPDGAALAGFVRTRDPLRGGRRVDVCLVVDATGAVHHVPLGDAASNDRAIGAWRATLRPATGRRGLRRVDLQRDGSLASYRRSGRALRERVWDPVWEATGRASTVFLVADGAFHHVAFGALPRGERFVVEDVLLRPLSTERSLAMGRSQASGATASGGPEASGLLVVGAPGETIPSVRALPRVLACEGERGLAFGPLPGAAVEARDVARLYERTVPGARVRLLVGDEARERDFVREAEGRRWLHVATHGFAVADTCTSTSPPAGTNRAVSAGGRRPSSVSPLVRCGLVLGAGPGAEDGLLTAEEICALDLRGTELAVLTACGSGLGEVRDGEGVLGLRRAFEIAGVGATVLSLWEVGDDATRRWSRHFYRSLLEDGRGPAEAARAAMVAMIEDGRAGGDLHPFAWGGFVATVTGR